MTRSLNRLDIPQNDAISYVLKKSDGSQVTVSVPWVGSSIVSYVDNNAFYKSCLANNTLLKGFEMRQDPFFFKSSAPMKQQAAQVVNIIKGDQVNYYEIDGKVGVITIESFVPKSEVQFAKDFQMSMYTAKLNKIQRLIIDLTNNGGGEECLGYALIKYLYSSSFKENFATLFARTDMIATDLGRELAQAGAGLPSNTDSIWNPATWKSIDGKSFVDASWYTNQVSHVRSGYNASYTSILKENYCQPSFDNYYFTGEDLLYYAPDDIILISNGRCASTCALFSRHLQQSRKVKTVVVGGVKGEKVSLNV